jgi:ornithine carbamoyltransferase
MEALKGRDVLSLADLSPAEVAWLLDFAAKLKSGAIRPHCPKILGLLFSKASTRTRVSFSVAMFQMGGQILDLNVDNTQVSRGEPLEDTARVLERYLDVMAIRTYAQSDLETFAQHAHIPVINALTDLEHPCQALADLLTVQEVFGNLAGLKMAYVGDGNNVAHSLMIGCALVGVHIQVATPPGYVPDRSVVEQAKTLAGDRSTVEVTNSPEQAVKGAHVLYTDVWASMGQESSAESRVPLFMPYQINQQLLALADPNAIVLHCLPAHRGEEITDEVMEGTQSRVWQQAENRLHTQKALLAAVLGTTSG